MVITVIATVAAMDYWIFTARGLAAGFGQVLRDPADLLVVAGLLMASAVFHECGHATGCRYGGARPGRIGVGLYLVWPSFFTNVTDSYRLSRAGRCAPTWAGCTSTWSSCWPWPPSTRRPRPRSCWWPSPSRTWKWWSSCCRSSASTATTSWATSSACPTCSPGRRPAPSIPGPGHRLDGVRAWIPHPHLRVPPAALPGHQPGPVALHEGSGTALGGIVRCRGLRRGSGRRDRCRPCGPVRRCLALHRRSARAPGLRRRPALVKRPCRPPRARRGRCPRLRDRAGGLLVDARPVPGLVTVEPHFAPIPVPRCRVPARQVLENSRSAASTGCGLPGTPDQRVRVYGSRVTHRDAP